MSQPWPGTVPDIFRVQKRVRRVKYKGDPAALVVCARIGTPGPGCRDLPDMSSFAHITAVTFDAGGTLLKPWPSVGHVYAEVAARHGLERISPHELNRQFAAAWGGLKNFNHGREEWAALVDQTFAGLGEKPPGETFFSELYDRFTEPEAWHVFEDVLPTLDALAARGINRGVISNWDERLHPLLEKLRLRKYFDAVIISRDIGFPKPSPVIFEQASRKMGVAPQFILHVGDSPEHDLEGAKAAGFEALLLERGRGTECEGRIGSLLELETKLDKAIWSF